MARSTCQLLGRRLMQLKFTPGPQIYGASKHHTKLQRESSWPPCYIARMRQEGSCLRDTYWRKRGREAVTNQPALWFLWCSASPNLVGFYMDQLNFSYFVKKEIVWGEEKDGKMMRKEPESQTLLGGLLGWDGQRIHMGEGRDPGKEGQPLSLWPWSTEEKHFS